ncbi:MAG: galactokinase [Nocardioidaceae bacterium]
MTDGMTGPGAAAGSGAADPVRAWAAPGRVNLIGEHLDYNGGPVLPIAIDRRTTVKARARTDGRVRVWTTLQPGSVEFGVDTTPGDVPDWAAYVAGVVWSLGRAGYEVAGADLVVESDVPLGAGLSSSAALECAVGVAIAGTAGWSVDPVDMALIAQRAENEYVGVPSGAMDQLASMCAEAGHALLVDTAPSRPEVEPVAAPWVDDGLALVVIDTRAAHALADGEYARRRAECEQASELLGLETLSRAGPDAVLRLEDETLKARVRHVITETARTRSAVRALRSREWQHLGTLLTASHTSLRDDYEVSCDELDVAVDAALEARALGARMTGGGFGGSAIALVPADRVAVVVGAVERAFAAREFTAPRSFVVAPEGGAGPVAG